jgi:hypothetical protein
MRRNGWILIVLLSVTVSLAVTTAALASHARPKGATPTRISLVPAHKACVAPNQAHQGSLALPTCTSVVEESSLLTMKAPDRTAPFNAGATGSGYFQAKVYCTDATAVPCTTNGGDQLDDMFTLALTGVWCKAANGAGCTASNTLYSGYVGLSTMAIRVTDHLSPMLGSNPTGVGTTTDLGNFLGVTCASGNCNMTTSADTFFGGSAVQEQRRANWEFVGSGAFEIVDEGLDGVIGSIDDKVFLRPGLFNP